MWVEGFSLLSDRCMSALLHSQIPIRDLIVFLLLLYCFLMKTLVF